MPRRRSSRITRRAKSAKTVWRGIQFENTVVGTGQTFMTCIQRSDVEKYGKVTHLLTVGNVMFHNTDTDAANGEVRVGAKLLQWHINDASAVTDDVSGRDTDQEDIEYRHLWHAMMMLSPETNTGSGFNQYRVNIYSKGKLILQSEKEEFGLVCTANIINRCRITGYLRSLCLLG